MKSLLLAAALVISAGAQCLADNGRFWVIGNRATNSCDIVTSNPEIGGDIYFGTGPYNSMDDAKLARSTIGACPKQEDPPKSGASEQ